jgi:hypothetical protein
MGVEHRNLKHDWTVGLTTGLNYGQQCSVPDTRTRTKLKGYNVGLYHSLGFLENARYDLLINHIHNDVKNNRFNSANNQIYYGKNKMYTNVVDISTSYKFRLNETWSVRPNIGHTYITNKTTDYVEKTQSGVSGNLISVPNTDSKQVYAGIGVRASLNEGKRKLRLTAVYEIGKNYDTKSPKVKILNTSLPSNGVNTINGSPSRGYSNYFNINASLLDEETNLKGVLSYSTILQRGSTNHTFMLKTEYRFK